MDRPGAVAQLRAVLHRWLPPAVESSGQGEIDYSKLDAIMTDPEAQDKLLEDFLAHIDTDRAKLIEALTLGDRAGAQDTAHRMHGSSRMVGAMHVATASAAIELAAKDGHMEQARAGRPALDGAIERLRKQLASPRNLKVVQ